MGKKTKNREEILEKGKKKKDQKRLYPTQV